jgi:hypothetical protein
VQEINNAGYVVSKSSLRKSAKGTESQKRRGSFGRSKPTIIQETKRNWIPIVLKIESDFAHSFSVFFSTRVNTLQPSSSLKKNFKNYRYFPVFWNLFRGGGVEI